MQIIKHINIFFRSALYFCYNMQNMYSMLM